MKTFNLSSYKLIIIKQKQNIIFLSIRETEKANVGKSKEKEAALCSFDRCVNKVSLLGERCGNMLLNSK